MHELRKSISAMSDEELMEFIRSTRENRRETPAKKKAEASERVKKVKEKTASTNLLNDLSGLDASSLAALINMLDGNASSDE